MFGIATLSRQVRRARERRQTKVERSLRRSYDAASPRRFPPHMAFALHDSATRAHGPTIRARARHAYANNPLVRNAVEAIVAEVVGAGIEGNSAHPNPNVAAAIDAAFSDALDGLDADGLTDGRGLLAAIVRAEIVDGEAFVHFYERDRRLVARIIPTERVDESDTRNLANGHYTVAGVEFDANGDRVAYHVHRSDPNATYGAHGTVHIPAADMLHIFRPSGPGAVRGVSQLASVLTVANELDQWSDATIVGHKIAAMHAGFVVDVNATGAVLPPGEGLGDPAELSLEPGVVRVLPAGCDIRFNTPEQTKDGIPFAKFLVAQIAAGLGVPTHLVDGDLSAANYSSLRAGLLPFRAKCEQFVYHTLVPQFLDPLFRRVVTTEVVSGRLDVPDLADAFAVEWLPPRPMQVDPAKDAEAMRALMEMGLQSRRQAAASLGWNIAALDAEIAADREREAALGLSFSAEGRTDA